MGHFPWRTVSHNQRVFPLVWYPHFKGSSHFLPNTIAMALLENSEPASAGRPFPPSCRLVCDCRTGTWAQPLGCGQLVQAAVEIVMA
jgi:hypothetical protein